MAILVQSVDIFVVPFVPLVVVKVVPPLETLGAEIPALEIL
jgi:hypothetical protein